MIKTHDKTTYTIDRGTMGHGLFKQDYHGHKYVWKMHQNKAAKGAMADALAAQQAGELPAGLAFTIKGGRTNMGGSLIAVTVQAGHATDDNWHGIKATFAAILSAYNCTWQDGRNWCFALQINLVDAATGAPKTPPKAPQGWTDRFVAKLDLYNSRGEQTTLAF